MTVKATKRVPPSTGSAPVPGALPAVPTKVAQRTPASKQSALMSEMARAHSYKSLYERLSTKDDRSAEESYALAEIMARCGKNISQLGFQYRPRMGGEDRRKQFVDALSPKDPLRDKRIAAFDEINHDPCAGLEGLDVKQADVRALVASAAAAGDPKARATQVLYDVFESRRGDAKGAPPKPMTITDAQLDTLRSVMASDDPQAIMAASRALQMPFGNLTLRAGATEANLDGAAFHAAAQMIACDLGQLCSRDAPEVLQSCAVSGNCAAGDYREHMYFYNLSPASVQTMQQYYEQLQLARSGDWSYFTFFRGESPRSAFQPRPPGK